MNSKKAFEALFVSVFLLACGPVLAAKGFSYSFVDAGYNRLSGDDYDMDSAQVDLSFGVHEYVALRAGYIRGWTDGFPKAKDPSGDPDLNEFRVGLQPHYSVLKSLDVFGNLIYFNTKLNGDRSNSPKGYIYGAGVRFRAHKRFEARIAGEYRSGDTDNAFLVIGPVIKLTRKLDLSIRTSQSADDRDYFAGLRINF